MQKLLLVRSLRRTLAVQRSLWIRSLLEFPLEFVTIEVSLWRCLEQLSLQYFVQKLLLGKFISRTLPPMSSLPGLLPSSYLSGRLLVVAFATRLTCIAAGARQAWCKVAKHTILSFTDLRCRQTTGRVVCVVKIVGINREVSEGKLISDYGRIYSCEGQQEAANGQDLWGFFKDAHGF